MRLGAERVSYHPTTSVDRWDYLARMATLLSKGLIYDVEKVDGRSVGFLPSQCRSKDVYFQHIWMLLGELAVEPNSSTAKSLLALLVFCREI